MSRRTKTDPTIVAAYTRVSRVGGRAGDGFISFEDQENAIRRRAEELGLTIPDDAWYREADASGGSFQNRPKWDEMMARIEDPDDPLGGFIAVRTDRFSRNVAEGAAVAKRLKDMGCNFVLVDVPVDLTTPEGELMFTHLLGWAQYQLESLKTSWWRAKKYAIERGAHIGRTPTGFRRVPRNAPRDAGKLVVLDEWRGPIERLFRHVDENPHLGDVALANWANQHNPRPDGKRWYPGLVGRMLSNPVYIGRVAYEPSDSGVKWPYGPLENPNAHEPMIDESLFQRVQLKRAPSRPAQQLNNQRPKKGRKPALLQGLVRCAGCQHLMKPSMAGKRVPVYHCDGGKRRANGECPRPATISRHIIEPYVVAQVLASDEVVHARLFGRHEVDDETLRAAQQAVEDARANLERIKANIDLAARKPELWEEIVERAEQGLRDAQAAQRELLAATTPPIAVPREFRWDDLDVEQQRALIAAAVDCIFVRSGRGLPPERRTLILWKGQAADYQLDLPGKGRPAKRPIQPIDWDDPVVGIRGS